MGRTNKKDGADRLVDGVQIQTKYADSGRKCISDCFDKTTGAFRYFNPDGTTDSKSEKTLAETVTDAFAIFSISDL